VAPVPVSPLATAAHHRGEVALRDAEFDAHTAWQRPAELVCQALHLAPAILGWALWNVALGLTEPSRPAPRSRARARRTPGWQGQPAAR
jgi:hypothetical protein